MATQLEDLLLEVLRKKTGCPGLRYAAPPLPVAGGFWAQILAVRLEGAPPELDRDLIVRIMPDPDAAKRETIVQSEVVAQGFPAPPVRLVGGPDDGLGRAFMVMDRMPGRPPVPEVTGPAAFAALGRAATRLPDLLADTTARLHALDPEPLRRALIEEGTTVVLPGDLLRVVGERAAGADRPDLARAAQRMAADPPARGREVICHGDLHPFNLLVEGRRVSVIDWSVALIGDPAFDLAFTALTMAAAPIAVPRVLRRPVRAAARSGSRWFLRSYRKRVPGAADSLREDVLDWFTAVHCLRALVELAQWVAAGTVDEQAGHPWLVMAPNMAVHLGKVVGDDVRPM